MTERLLENLYDDLQATLKKMQSIVYSWGNRPVPSALRPLIASLKTYAAEWDIQSMETTSAEISDLLMPMETDYHVQLSSLLLNFWDLVDEVYQTIETGTSIEDLPVPAPSEDDEEEDTERGVMYVMRSR